jgi:hypothetical protein
MGNLGSKFLSNRGNWKAILLLSIILPVGFFMGLKLSGIVPTAKLETVTLAPLAWRFNLPTGYMVINQTLNATYADASGRVSFRLNLGSYDTFENNLDLGIVFMAVPLNRGFSVRSVLVYFGNDSQPSIIDFASYTVLDTFENLTLKAASWGEEAGILFSGNRTGVGCQFSAVGMWDLPTASNVTYEKQADFEVTYFNGTDYKRVVQPFNLTLQAIGYHYLSIGSSLEGKVTNGVPVWVDGVKYSTPVNGLIVKQGVHNITTAPSSGYYIDSWILVNKSTTLPIGSTHYGNPTTVDINADYSLTLYVLKLPSISPSSVTMDVGQSQTFTSTVDNGTTSPHYQWYLNGAPVSGATSSSWTFESSSTQTGSNSVYLKITDAFGVNATSNTATVTVNQDVGEQSSPLYANYQS